MAIAIVQSVSGTVNSAGSIAKTIASTGSGNTLLVSATCTNTSVVMTPSVSAGTNQTFVSIQDEQPGTGQLQAWYVKNCAAGTTSITVTRASGTGQFTIVVTEVSGLDLNNPLDKSAGSAAASDTTGTTGTTGRPDEFWWASGAGASSAAPAPVLSAPSSGWTQDQNPVSNLGGANTDVGNITAYQITTNTATANMTWTSANVVANGHAGIVATFFAVSVAPPPLRIPNKFVGPMAMRHNFKQPYYPVGATAVQAALGPDTDVAMWGQTPNQPVVNYYKGSVTDY